MPGKAKGSRAQFTSIWAHRDGREGCRGTASTGAGTSSAGCSSSLVMDLCHYLQSLCGGKWSHVKRPSQKETAKGIFQEAWDICLLGQTSFVQVRCLSGPGMWSAWGWCLPRYTKVPASYLTWETCLNNRVCTPSHCSHCCVRCSTRGGICPGSLEPRSGALQSSAGTRTHGLGQHSSSGRFIPTALINTFACSRLVTIFLCSGFGRQHCSLRASPCAGARQGHGGQGGRGSAEATGGESLSLEASPSPSCREGGHIVWFQHVCQRNMRVLHQGLWCEVCEWWSSCFPCLNGAKMSQEAPSSSSSKRHQLGLI